MRKPVIVAALLAGSLVGAEKQPEIFLCTDGAKSKGPQFLVYTYVNGRKTDCMPKSELLEHYRQTLYGENRQDAEAQLALRRIDSCKAVNRTTKSYAGQDLRSQDFKGMKLAGADFRAANLESCDLRNADLRNADFTKANLTATYLKGADVRGANFSEANMNGTYLNEADMRGVRNLSLEAVRMCRTLYHAALDTTFREEIEFCCSDKLKTSSWYWHDNQWADERGKKRRQKARFEANSRTAEND